MSRFLVAAACGLALLGTGTARADDAAREAEVRRLASLGRYGDAERLSRELTTPYGLAYRAIAIAHDDVLMRTRGLTEFDPTLADELARKAIPGLQKAAATDPPSSHILGRLYESGVGVKKDLAAGLRWQRSAADRGYALAIVNVGYHFFEGEGVPKDPSQGIAWYKRASDAGYPRGHVALASVYEHGIGVPANPARAAALYEKAAAAGSLDGMMGCGRIALARANKAFAGGDVSSGSKYMIQFNRWSTEAADLGDHSAMLQRSIALRVLDPVEAFGWVEKASRCGLSHALVHRAAYLMSGTGCDADRPAALESLKAALAAAKRDGNARGSELAERSLAEKDPAAMIAALERELGWGKPVEPAVEFEPGAFAGLKGFVQKAATASRQASTRADRDAVPTTKLVLYDLAWTPSASGNYISVEGRVRNDSAESLTGIRVNVTYEDRAGRLVTTSGAFLEPTSVAPGGVATFKTFDQLRPAMDHVKLDFLPFTGGSVPWADRSGKNAHE